MASGVATGSLYAGEGKLQLLVTHLSRLHLDR
jgi:hypothetical protein